MYSRLDPIFKTQLRHTESLDTRQGIKRHDRIENKEKRGGEDEDNHESDMWEDKTTVSVRALKTFLEQLAGEVKKEDRKPDAHDDGAVSEDIDVSQLPSSVAAAQTQDAKNKQNAAHEAAQAYQRTHRATHADEQPEVLHSAIPSIDLRPEEIRVIHKLIEDLGALAAQNIERLTIRKSESFLQGLVDAVNDIK